MAGMVRDNDAISRRDQGRDLRPPCAPRVADAVQQENGPSLAERQEVVGATVRFIEGHLQLHGLEGDRFGEEQAFAGAQAGGKDGQNTA
jgi:hypothetical protein